MNNSITYFLDTTFHSLSLDVNTRVLLTMEENLQRQINITLPHVWEEHQYRTKEGSNKHRIKSRIKQPKSMFLPHMTPNDIEDILFETFWQPRFKTARQVNDLSGINFLICKR